MMKKAVLVVSFALTDHQPALYTQSVVVQLRSWHQQLFYYPTTVSVFFSSLKRRQTQLKNNI